MLPGSHALQVLTSKDLIEVRHGSCVRHRFSRADCRQCFDICPSKALDWDEDGLHWDASRCQECLLCTSSCPSGALQGSEISFVSLLQDLAEVDRPVVACSTIPKTSGHVRVPCLGILANPELLLAMTLALGRPIRLNLTACAECQNAAVTEPLMRAVQKLPNLNSEAVETVKLVYSAEMLEFEESSCSRRKFFSLLRNRSQRAGVCIADRLQADRTQKSYGLKKLPATRRLLLQVLKQLPENYEEIGEKLFPQRVSNDSCRSCTGCIGICPTGALAPATEPDTPPRFIADLCVNCRLCENFCSSHGITIRPPG